MIYCGFVGSNCCIYCIRAATLQQTLHSPLWLNGGHCHRDKQGSSFGNPPSCASRLCRTGLGDQLPHGDRVFRVGCPDGKGPRDTLKAFLVFSTETFKHTFGEGLVTLLWEPLRLPYLEIWFSSIRVIQSPLWVGRVAGFANTRTGRPGKLRFR